MPDLNYNFAPPVTPAQRYEQQREDLSHDLSDRAERYQQLLKQHETVYGENPDPNFKAPMRPPPIRSQAEADNLRRWLQLHPEDANYSPVPSHQELIQMERDLSKTKLAADTASKLAGAIQSAEGQIPELKSKVASARDVYEGTKDVADTAASRGDISFVPADAKKKTPSRYNTAPYSPATPDTSWSFLPFGLGHTGNASPGRGVPQSAAIAKAANRTLAQEGAAVNTATDKQLQTEGQSDALQSDADRRFHFVVDPVKQTISVPGLAQEFSFAPKAATTTTNVAAPAPAPAVQPDPVTETRRKTRDGRFAIFDANTKQFLRYDDGSDNAGPDASD